MLRGWRFKFTLWDFGSAFGDVQLEDPAEVTAGEISAVMTLGLPHHIGSRQDGFSNFLCLINLNMSKYFYNAVNT